MSIITRAEYCLFAIATVPELACSAIMVDGETQPFVIRLEAHPYHPTTAGGRNQKHSAFVKKSGTFLCVRPLRYRAVLRMRSTAQHERKSLDIKEVACYGHLTLFKGWGSAGRIVMTRTKQDAGTDGFDRFVVAEI